ncbi:MAG: hypothetical protein ACOYMS_09545, partial [Terrimicrobiaceae bacterium]
MSPKTSPGRTVILLLVLSLLSARAEVKQGSELVRGENCGIPAGTKLEESADTVFKHAEVITDKILGSVKTTHTEGVVKFVRCKFVNPGFVPLSEGEKASPGSAFYTVQRAGPGSVELEDCEVYGGKSVAIVNVDKVTRTYVAEGNDLLRAPEGESFYTEVLGEKLLMSSPESHSDIMQVTFGKDRLPENPAVATIHVIRCKFDARGRIGDDGKSADPVNGAIQLGSFGPNTGVKGEITDCFFDGGAFTLSGGSRGEAGQSIVLRGNKFGRNSKYGATNPNWRKDHDVDDSNVWADTGEP